MATPFSLTHQPIRYTTATGPGFQPMFLATNISGFDLLDVEAGIVAVEGSVTAFTVDLYTSNQNQTDDGWLPVGTTLFTSITNNTWAKSLYQTGLLKFLRWKVSAITGGTAVTFFIRGMGRSYSKPTRPTRRWSPAATMYPTVAAPTVAAAAPSTVYNYNFPSAPTMFPTTGINQAIYNSAMHPWPTAATTASPASNTVGTAHIQKPTSVLNRR